MNWRLPCLFSVLATALTMSAAPSASADPPPWAGVWRHQHDRGAWHGGRGEFTARCGQIIDRIGFDRRKIVEITPTGRHRKALQWYKDDLRNAQRDLYNCRNRVAYGPPPSYDATAYDPYDVPAWDPYGGGFDWKRDWPYLLGALVNPQR